MADQKQTKQEITNLLKEMTNKKVNTAKFKEALQEASKLKADKTLP